VEALEKITELAADTLRAWALDEDLKRRVMSTPALAGLATTVASRYTAGETADDAIAAARAGLARHETDVFLTLAAATCTRRSRPSTLTSASPCRPGCTAPRMTWSGYLPCRGRCGWSRVLSSKRTPSPGGAAARN
jgi:hypothetical protein